MTDDEVIARALVARYRDMRDERFKLSYLPYREVRVLSLALEQQQKPQASGPIAVLNELHSSVVSCLSAQVRVDRRVAVLRTIEAIRLYASAHEGKLPESLGQITEVPVPDDPATGKPFEYHHDGEAALLAADDAGLEYAPSFRLIVRPGEIHAHQ